MKCTKCGYIGFDHVSTCAKCGKDLDEARHELNLWDFAPAIPSFLVETILSMCRKAETLRSTAAMEASARGVEGNVDLLGEIDLKVDLDEKPEEITLEFLDEGEEPLVVPEPLSEKPAPASSMQVTPTDGISFEEKPLSLEEEPQGLDLKIEGFDDPAQEPGMFDLSDVEDVAEYVEPLDEEGLSDEALERLRRELETVDGLIQGVESGSEGEAVLEVDFSQLEAAEPVVQRLPAEDGTATEEELVAVVESAEVDTEDDTEEDVFILMEERDGGLAVQEFSLEEGTSKEEKSAGNFEEDLALDLEALEKELEPKAASRETPEPGQPAEDGLVLELEDGFYIEPDEEEEES
ncbi:MAG: hypothetical protein WHS46_05230 [Desulfosoma sp.]